MTAGERFVHLFEEFWAKPDPARLPELVHEDVHLVQPLVPEMRSMRDFQEQIARLLKVMPDFSGHTRDWAERGDTVMIEHTLGGTLGGRRIEWDLLDRITLVDGKVSERIASFDSLPLVVTILRRPRAWVPFARLRFGKPTAT